MSGLMETELSRQQPEEPHSLSQVERVADVFVAPLKTFSDIRRDASWWLPFLLGVLISTLFVMAVDRRIGINQVAMAGISRNAQAQQKISTLTPAERQRVMQKVITSTRVIGYAYPIGALVFSLVAAFILMISFNFGLGAQIRYKQYLATWFYAGMPLLLKFLLASILIFAGVAPEGFDIRNPIGTNLGWYLPPGTSQWVRTLLSSIDVFTIWTAILLIVGCATVAHVKRRSAALIVIGWWIFTMLAGAMATAVQKISS